MFTTSDLWLILDYLKTDVADDALDSKSAILAASEKALAEKFFDATLDQLPHMSNDYLRLRDFLKDWYASHRTLTSTQKQATDIFSLPVEHINELFRSFGFPYALNIVPLTSRVNLFLDLVNLYKKKGTPEAMSDILDYYGFSNVDIVEYWLMKNTSGTLIFRPRNVRRASTLSTIILHEDIEFDSMIGSDPHWRQSKEDITTLLTKNQIHLPSKTPYFSLSSSFYLYKLNSAISIMTRVVQDQYNSYSLGLNILKDIEIISSSNKISILELYCAASYSYNRIYPISSSNDFEYFKCYDSTGIEYISDPPNPENLSNLYDEYNNLISRPTSRVERDAKLTTLINDWSRPLLGNFFYAPNWITNGDFSSWSGNNPVGWLVNESEVGSSVQQSISGGECRIISTGNLVELFQYNSQYSGTNSIAYIEFDIVSISGTLTVNDGNSFSISYTTPGHKILKFNVTDGGTFIYFWSNVACDVIIDNVSYVIGYSCSKYLQQINPDLKINIDTYIDAGSSDFIITNLFNAIDSWIRTNIDSATPSLAITALGFGFKNELNNVINFFKPYRARLKFLDTVFSINNPLTNSIIIDDPYLLTVNDYVVDINQAGGIPCDGTASIVFDPRYTYDCPISNHDVGIINDHIKIEFWDSTSIISTTVVAIDGTITVT